MAGEKECSCTSSPLTGMERLFQSILTATTADIDSKLDAVLATLSSDEREGIFQRRQPADGTTALMTAVAEGCEWGVVEALLARGADPSQLTEDRIFAIPPVEVALVGGRNLLHLAYQHGAPADLIQRLTAAFPHMVDALDWNGERPPQLSRAKVDPLLPSKRRLLRAADVAAFESFVGCSVADFFNVPDDDAHFQVLAPGLTSFQMLSPDRCDQILAFLTSKFSSSSSSSSSITSNEKEEKSEEGTRAPPNTMNRYGYNLRSSPFWDVVSHLMIDYMGRLMKSHIRISVEPYQKPEAEGGLPLPGFAATFNDIELLDPNFEFTSQHCFIIEYQQLPPSAAPADAQESGRDRLAFHYDKSYFTVNLCLQLPQQDDEQCGSTLYFDYTGRHPRFDFDNVDDLFALRHQKGRAVLHSGKLFHGASPITRDKRCNLIIWGR